MKERWYRILQDLDYSSYIITPSKFKIMKLCVNILILNINISQYIYNAYFL